MLPTLPTPILDPARAPSPRLRGRVSTIGLGACRSRGDENPAAIAAAIRGGCTVLDTAPHYHQGAHERAVGEAVRSAGERTSLTVNTKVGRIPELIANNRVTLGFARLKSYIEQHYISTGLFSWDDLAHSDHTLAPAYIEHSVQQSLERTGLAYFDCVFVESPEQQLRIASPADFARRTIAAFTALEALCASGRIRSYGVATTTVLDLEQLVEHARSAGGHAHHLRALQIPVSLLRPDMVSARVPARAADLGLHVYANGCLDGGTPGYQLPEELATALGDLHDAAVAIRWAQSVPGVGTVLFGSRDVRHVRANLAAAALPLLDANLFASEAAS